MNLGQMEIEVREMFSFPEVATGGTDKLVQLSIWKWISDAFTNMVNAIDGLETYIEFTITTSWGFTITVPVASGATISGTVLDGGDHRAFRVSDLRTWGEIVNLTDGTGQPRSLLRVVYNETGWKADQVQEQNYFDEFDIINLGMVLLPTINQTNTIGLHYKKAATELGILPTVFDGSGINDLTPGTTGVALGYQDRDFQVVIDATGTPDTFKWSSDGGANFTAGVNCTTTALTLQEGITIKFGATTGHTLNDQWDFDLNCNPDTHFDAEYHNKYPVNYACIQLCKKLEDTRLGMFKEDSRIMLNEFVSDYLLKDLGAETHTIENSLQSSDFFAR